MVADVIKALRFGGVAGEANGRCAVEQLIAARTTRRLATEHRATAIVLSCV